MTLKGSQLVAAGTPFGVRGLMDTGPRVSLRSTRGYRLLTPSG